MDKQTAIKIAKEYFPNYPNAAAFHITEDGQAFEDKSFANIHAKSLVKQGEEAVVISVTRDDDDADDAVTVPAVAAAAKPAATKAAKAK